MAESTTKTYRVMVAQVSPERERLVDALRKQTRFRVVGVSGNGLEFIQMFYILKPDLVIVDAALSELDGLGVLGQISTEEFRDVRRIMMSYCSGFVEAQAARMGIDLFITEPANHTRVAQLAMALLDMAQPTEVTDDQVLQETKRILLELLPTLKPQRVGVTDICNGVLLLIRDQERNQNVTSNLYPAIGACREVRWTVVERSIRTLVNDIWKGAPLRLLEQAFPQYFQDTPLTPGKPTAASFLVDLSRLVAGHLHYRQTVWYEPIQFQNRG